MSRSDLTDIEVHMHHRTAKAVLVSTDGDSDNAVWIPLSACEIDPHERLSNVYVLTCRENLAVEKGLV